VAAEEYGLAEARPEPVNVPEPVRLLPVTRNGCAASCGPHPAGFATALAAHSERNTFPPTANPVTRTVTGCPFRSPVDGVTVIRGWVQENPGVPDRGQAFGLVRATGLPPAGAPVVAGFAPVVAGAGDWLLHETAGKHTKTAMTAVRSRLRPAM